MAQGWGVRVNEGQCEWHDTYCKVLSLLCHSLARGGYCLRSSNASGLPPPNARDQSKLQGVKALREWEPVTPARGIPWQALVLTGPWLPHLPDKKEDLGL